MTKLYFFPAAVATALIATTLAVSPGYANAPAANTVAVSHADLDLSRSADRQVLDQRIADAARRACRPAPDVTLIARSTVLECRAAAIENAQDQIPGPAGATD